jgi:hypothetical protein
MAKKMKKTRLVSYLTIVCLLLLSCLTGCGSNKQPTALSTTLSITKTRIYWHASEDNFQTNDLTRAQAVVPFTLILPAYLPDGLDSQKPFNIDGPLDITITDYLPVSIQYGNGEKQVTISESNVLSIIFPNSNQEPRYVDISGISVLREKYIAYFGTNHNIPAYGFSWNQANYTFSVDVWTYSEEEGEKIVASMIKQIK